MPTSFACPARRAPALAACAMVLFATLMTPALAGDHAKDLAAFKTDVEQYRRDRSVLSLSYAIVMDGRIVAAEGIGWQDHDGEEPTTPDTTYLVASITKTFTGATLLAMDADGVIDLDDAFTALSDWPERCAWLASSGIVFGGGKPLDDGHVRLSGVVRNALDRRRADLLARALGAAGVDNRLRISDEIPNKPRRIA